MRKARACAVFWPFRDEDSLKIRQSSALPAMNVVSVTQEEHNRNPAIPHSWYVIERIHADSVVVWQDESGSIYQVQSSDPPVKIASGLSEYMNS